jgi:ABC-type multidrug transport system fused ATPase/permease subunit
MVLLARVTGLVVAIFALLGMIGCFTDRGPDGRVQVSLVIFFALGLAAAGWLFYHAAQRSGRDARVALSQKLLALGRATGTLTVAQVIASLSLTKQEASDALTQLSRDGLATFEVDSEGSPLYRIARL